MSLTKNNISSLAAVREALLNTLIHRDYNLHTEGMPIQLLFEDRFEVRSPGGLYDQLRIDQLGKVQPDTRNPVLAVAMEVLGETENLLHFCVVPRTRQEVAEFLGIKSVTYAIKARVMPLVEHGLIRLTVPGRPRNPKQQYVTTQPK